MFSIIEIKALNAKINNDSLNKSNPCKELAILSAQLTNESFECIQNCYFNSKDRIISKNIDSAIYLIKQSISLLDSVILMTNDSNLIGINLAKNARNFSIDAYRCLKYLNSNNTFNTEILLKKAMYFCENATIDAYHSSLYLFDKTKKEIKQDIEKESKNLTPIEKIITKLDVDQSLFAILIADLNEKKETNSKEITKLNDDLYNSKNATLNAQLNAQLKDLEIQKTILNKRLNDAQQRLNSINLLIAERDKPKTDSINIKDNAKISEHTKHKNNNEWNKQIKVNSEMPDDLIYQIQLGVFKSKVLESFFKGLNPIYTTITENGVCYSIGLFEKYIDAKEAKNNIINMGLTKSFIVAYYNKKKISIVEAAKLEKK